MKLKRYDGNPILSPNPANEWENFCVLNPGVIYDCEKGEFVMLYRAAGDTEMHHIHLGLATSKDGFHFERQSDQPVFSPSVGCGMRHDENASPIQKYRQPLRMGSKIVHPLFRNARR